MNSEAENATVPEGVEEPAWREAGAINIGQMTGLVTQLRDTGAHGSFAVLMFPPPKPLPGSGDYINLQYSVDQGVLGLDWVLLGARQKEDRELVAQFISSRGHTVTEREANGVGYLRVEDGDLVELGTRIARGLYLIAPDAKMDLIVSGFDYDPNPVDGKPATQSSTTVDTVIAEAHKAAATMLSNAGYILGELDKVCLSGALHAQTEQVCKDVVGTSKDIVSGLSELDETVSSKCPATLVLPRIRRLTRWIRDDLDKMNALVMALEAVSEQDLALSAAYLLVAESATNIIDAYGRLDAVASVLDREVDAAVGLAASLTGPAAYEAEALQRGIETESGRLGSRRFLVAVNQHHFDSEGLTDYVFLMASFDRQRDAESYARNLGKDLLRTLCGRDEASGKSWALESEGADPRLPEAKPSCALKCVSEQTFKLRAGPFDTKHTAIRVVGPFDGPIVGIPLAEFINANQELWSYFVAVGCTASGRGSPPATF